MKSNLSQIMNELMPELKEKGYIDIEELLDEVEKDFQMEGHFNKKNFIRKHYLQPRIENIINCNKFYAVSKKKFIYLESANLQDLLTIEGNFEKDIESRQGTLRRIKAKEKERWEQQLKFTFVNNVAVGTEEEGPLIKKAEGI